MSKEPGALQLAAQEPFVQKPLGSRQQAGIDGPGTECLSDVGHRTTHRSQKGLPAIVEQMPPVRDLHCIRKSPGNGAAVTAIAVAGHDLYTGVAVLVRFANMSAIAIYFDPDTEITNCYYYILYHLQRSCPGRWCNTNGH